MTKYRIKPEYGYYSVEAKYPFWPFWLWKDTFSSFNTAVGYIETKLGRILTQEEFKSL